jgi:hypothetical protein
MTGMREQEVMHVYWSDINFSAITVRARTGGASPEEAAELSESAIDNMTDDEIESTLRNVRAQRVDLYRRKLL